MIEKNMIEKKTDSKSKINTGKFKKKSFYHSEIKKHEK